MPQSFGLYFHESGAEGKGTTPLLLLHGAGGSHLYWPPEIRRLNGYRVLAPDLPGHGKSNEVSGFQRIHEYADWMHNWLTEMKLRQVVVAGHSMGGAIGLALALQYPDCVTGLALISTGARLSVNQALVDETSSQATYLKAIQRITEWSFGPQASPRLVELARQRMTESRQSVLHGDLQACNQFDVVSEIGKIACPTLVLCGCDDRMTPYRFSQYLSTNIQKSHLHLIPDAGHMVMLEQPREVAGALEAFIERLVQSREVV